MELEGEATYVRETLTHNLRNALFNVLYAHFEQALDRICWHFSVSRLLKPTDLRNTGISRSQAYLKKVVFLPFPDNTPEWSDIQKFAKLRNHVVHAGLQLSDRDTARAVRSIAAENMIQITDQGRIQYREGFLERVFATLDRFLQRLASEIG